MPDRQVELTDRSRDQHREPDREHQRDRPCRQREITPGLTPLCRGFLQPFDLALGQTVAGGQHRLRARRQIRVAFRQGGARARLPMRPLEQHKEPALGVGQFAELGQLRAFQRQLLQLLRGLVKILAQTCVIVDQLRIVENEMLADEPLQRRCLLVELPARAPRLRCLQDRLLALRPEPIEADDQLDQRVEQREADEQEAEQDELEEGTGVVHE